MKSRIKQIRLVGKGKAVKRSQQAQRTLWKQVDRSSLPDFVRQFYGVSQGELQRKVKRPNQPVVRSTPVVVVEPSPVLAAVPAQSPRPAPPVFSGIESQLSRDSAPAGAVEHSLPVATQRVVEACPPVPVVVADATPPMPVSTDDGEVPCAPEPCQCEHFRPTWSYARHFGNWLLVILCCSGAFLFGSVSAFGFTSFWSIAALIWFSWRAPREVSFECFTCVLDRVSRRTKSDRQLLSFAFRTLFMTSRDQSRFRELKLRLEAQMRLQHPEWTQERVTLGVLSVLRGVSKMFAHEMQWVGTLETQLSAMKKAHQFAKTGTFSSGRQLPQV